MRYTKLLLIAMAVGCHYSASAQTQWSVTGNAGTTPGTNFLGTTDNKDFIIKTNGTQRLLIDAAGNISFGTQPPRGLFDIGKEGDVYLTAEPNGGNSGSTNNVFLSGHVYLAPYGTSNISYLQARRWNNLGTTELRIRTYDNDNLVEAMNIGGNGNVAIGAISSTEKLTVAGNIFLQGNNNYFQLHDRLTLQVTNTAANNWTRSLLGHNVKWNPATEKWKVEGGAYDDFSMIRFANNGAIVFYARNVTGTPGELTDAEMNAFRKMSIDHEGNVAIGTDNPHGYKLAVNGSAIFTLAKVKEYGSWPDYVFKKDYQLLSLAELEKYIQQNNHLPGIPAAAEVEKEGLDLGSNQAALLKKIEELTLYIIEQNRKMERLESKITSLEKKVNNESASKQ